MKLRAFSKDHSDSSVRYVLQTNYRKAARSVRLENKLRYSKGDE